jgi:WD40 repeat protein
VFLSHTGELRAHPAPRSFVAAVEHAVALAGDTAVDMDYFGARDDEPAAFCVRQVRGCDIYLGLIGFRYGTPVPDRPELSYTELEYEAATAAGIPRLVFLLDDDAEVPIRDFADRVYGDRQDRFRERLKAGGIIAAGFRAPADLETAVLKALVTLREEQRRPGPATDGAAVVVVPSPTSGRRPWLVPARYNRVVARPALTDAVVDRLTAAPGGADRPPVVLHGGGGFGKTTLAVEVCNDPRIAARFPGGILWTTLGEALSGAGLADRINDLCEALSGSRPTLADPEQAGFRLGELLGDEPRLLVVDDAWLRSQVRPFLQGGSATVRLVTTRMRDLLPNADGVAVAAMRVDEARELLVDGLGGDLPAAEVRRLLALTGRWPVLVTLVNRAMWRYVRDGLPVERAAYRVRRRLERRGPTALDVSRPEDRQEAVEATLAATLALLTGDRLDRYLELAIFPEDVDVPRRVLNLLWGATGDLDSFEVDELCGELADLSLVLAYRGDPPSLRLQDVLRSYLQGRAGAARLRATNGALLDAAADILAAASPAGAPDATRRWWTLPDQQAYLWKNLAYHLAEAGRDEELRSLARDLRWAVAKFARADLGPVAVEADLGLAQKVTADPVVVALRRAIGQAAHLLTPVEPAAAIGAVLVSRLDGIADVEEPVRRYAATLDGPRLVNRWPLPDRPHPALRRVLRAHNDRVSSCAVAADGDWIASAAADGFARVWDARTGTPRREWAGPGGELRLWRTGPVELTVVAMISGRVVRWDVETGQDSTVLAPGERFDRCTVAPDGAWFAGVSGEMLRVWRLPDPGAPADPGVRAGIEVHVAGDVATMVVAPGGEWFATGHCDGTVRVWDPSDGRGVLTLPGPSDVWALAPGTDPSTLVAGYRDGSLRIFDVPGGRCRQVLVDDDPATTRSGVRAAAFGPDGRWLACGTTNGKIKVWDLATGTRRAAFAGHTARVTTCAVTVDETLVTGGEDDTVRIWAVAAVDGTDSPPSAAERVGACAVSPDGTWFATGARDACISLWDLPAPGISAASEASLLRTFGPVRGWVNALAVAPRGDWIASTHWDPAVHIWDVRGGGPLVTLDAGAESVRTCAVAPDGSWLATGGSDGRVLLWDMPAGTRRSVVTQESGTIFACVAGPDGSWLATGGAEGALRIWDTAGGIRRHEFAAAAAHHVRAAAAAPDGSWVASGHGDGTARIWDLAAGRLRVLVRANERCVYGCAASPDSTLLATCGEDGTLRIFDARTGGCVTVMRVDGILLGCAWLTDGTGLTAVGAGSIYLFDLVR